MRRSLFGCVYRRVRLLLSHTSAQLLILLLLGGKNVRFSFIVLVPDTCTYLISFEREQITKATCDQESHYTLLVPDTCTYLISFEREQITKATCDQESHYTLATYTRGAT